jgi:HupE / UreJ protein
MLSTRSAIAPSPAADIKARTAGPTAVQPFSGLRWLLKSATPVIALVIVCCQIDAVWGHGIGGKDAAFVAATKGPDILPFMYLGAKHMVTGYDHLLFLLGVIFFLYRMRDVVIYVTLFSIGHSITLLAGVLLTINVNPFLVDAVIGLSVVYKAFDNLGGFKSIFGVQPNNKIAVSGFGLIHGFGLATKLQALRLNSNGLVPNMVGFNVGVEIGQLIALAVILAVMLPWRRTANFERFAVAANALILAAGFVLMEYQLAAYFGGMKGLT